MKCVVIVSVACAVVLAGLCAGRPADTDPDPDTWFSTSPVRARRAIATETSSNATRDPLPLCVSMSLRYAHGVEPLTTPPPYTVTVDKTRVAPGGTVTVKVSGTEPFKGVYIQGREGQGKLEDVAVGSFLPEDGLGYASDCFGGDADTLTLISDEMDEVELKWKAPDTPGKVTFRCTVVKSFRDHWVGILSPEIEIRNSEKRPNVKRH